MILVYLQTTLLFFSVWVTTRFHGSFLQWGNVALQAVALALRILLVWRRAPR